MGFADIHRVPDHVTVQTEDKWIELAGSNGRWSGTGAEVTTKVDAAGVQVSLEAPETAVKRIKLRWKCRIDDGALILNDHWERGYGDLEWRRLVPERVLPWYFMLNDRTCTHGYGVMTGPSSMCFWQVDSAGMTLWLDVRCGGNGVRLVGRRLEAATVICRAGKERESAFEATTDFCRRMCPKPVLPSFPVYGGNNWYYAYGKSSHGEIVNDAKLISQLSSNTQNRPFMVIDDGWQICHGNGFNGGPWHQGNTLFPDMQKLAADMKEAGTRPGIWMRPLLTVEKAPWSWSLPKGRFKGHHEYGVFLDPSVPDVLNKVREDIKRIAGWGYELIKHDFTSFDIFGRWGFEMGAELVNDGWSFADNSKTTAEVIKGLYEAIAEAAGDVLIIGCNTVSHLSAGLFEIQRTGDDTSGRVWERTRKYGINTLAFRMPQHNNFYAADADCVGLTKAVPWKYNKQWLELLAASGTPLFISASPDAIGPEQERAMRDAFELASKAIPAGEPLDWMHTTCPRKWKLNGQEIEFDWYDEDGVNFF